MFLARKHRSSNRIGLLTNADELSGDADRAVRQIFGNSDDESDLDFDFDMEVEKTEECSSDILTREYFNVDCEFVGPTMRMSPSK